MAGCALHVALLIGCLFLRCILGALTSDIETRAAQLVEGVHLLNCAFEGEPRLMSLVVDCTNDFDCSDLAYEPDENSVCVKHTTTWYEDWYQWEGGNKSCTFPSGITFSWEIPLDAQSNPDYTGIGRGWNGRRTFGGYKDNHRRTFYWRSHTCVKIYYYV